MTLRSSFGSEGTWYTRTVEEDPVNPQARQPKPSAVKNTAGIFVYTVVDDG